VESLYKQQTRHATESTTTTDPASDHHVPILYFALIRVNDNHSRKGRANTTVKLPHSSSSSSSSASASSKVSSSKSHSKLAISALPTPKPTPTPTTAPPTTTMTGASLSSSSVSATLPPSGGASASAGLNGHGHVNVNDLPSKWGGYIWACYEPSNGTITVLDLVLRVPTTRHGSVELELVKSVVRKVREEHPRPKTTTITKTTPKTTSTLTTTTNVFSGSGGMNLKKKGVAEKNDEDGGGGGGGGGGEGRGFDVGGGGHSGDLRMVVERIFPKWIAQMAKMGFKREFDDDDGDDGGDDDDDDYDGGEDHVEMGDVDGGSGKMMHKGQVRKKKRKGNMTTDDGGKSGNGNGNNGNEGDVRLGMGSGSGSRSVQVAVGEERATKRSSVDGGDHLPAIVQTLLKGRRDGVCLVMKQDDILSRV
jgi:hypothetical protein